MTTVPSSSRRGHDRRRHQASAPPAPVRPSGRALRAEAQRAATYESLQHAPTLRERLSGPIEEFAPLWKQVTALVLSLLGLGVSVYLTVDHFAHIALACS